MRILSLAFALAACGHSSSSSSVDSGSVADSVSDPCGGQAACIVTTSGPIQGVVDGALWEWKGVPYAAPPIGDLRWRPPQPITPWTTPLATTTFGAECMQLDLSTAMAAGGSEDCLTLNVWRPAIVDHPLPVLFFIHGGYYVQGGADTTWHGQLAYDGARLAALGPAIVVTVQYRLGALGFLDDPTLAAPDDPHANYGTLDQIAALAWVKTNAAALGADPNHVMIFGQSAGGISVCQLLASPLASGLFQTAVDESGGGCLVHSAAYAIAQTQLVHTGLGCSTPECMRAASASAVTGALADGVTGTHHWGPTLDGTVEPGQPVDRFTAGTANQVPTIVGNTSDEMSSQIKFYYATDPTDEASYEADLGKLYTAAQVPMIAAQYPIANFSSAESALVMALTDGLYVCAGRRVARALATHTPTWRYIFEHGFAAADFPSGSPSLTPFGAYHFIDVPYEFEDTAPTDFTFSADETALSAQMAGDLVAFASTGVPSASWPAFDLATDQHFAFAVPSGAFAGYRTANCDFWDAL